MTSETSNWHISKNLNIFKTKQEGRETEKVITTRLEMLF